MKINFAKTFGKWEFGKDFEIVSPAIGIRRMTLGKATDWYIEIRFFVFQLCITWQRGRDNR